MPTFERQQQPCPACGAKLDAATNTTGQRQPRSGDISICWDCAEVLIFTDDGSLALCTDETIRSSPRLDGIRAAVIMARSAR